MFLPIFSFVLTIKAFKFVRYIFDCVETISRKILLMLLLFMSLSEKKAFSYMPPYLFEL